MELQKEKGIKTKNYLKEMIYDKTSINSIKKRQIICMIKGLKYMNFRHLTHPQTQAIACPQAIELINT